MRGSVLFAASNCYSVLISDNSLTNFQVKSNVITLAVSYIDFNADMDLTTRMRLEFSTNRLNVFRWTYYSRPCPDIL